jgi:hypothetical protein
MLDSILSIIANATNKKENNQLIVNNLTIYIDTIIYNIMSSSSR